MNIGLIDLDFISTKQLCNYNFGVLLVSSYYLEQGLKVRLIINLKYDNLLNYDKIYVFKDYKTKIQPIHLIDNYYSLPIEEYGEGFDNKPNLPDLPNLIYTKIKTDIYKPIIFYIRNGGKNFSISKDFSEKYYPTKLFFQDKNELLLREVPTAKRLLIYDSPELLFTTELGNKMMTETLKSSIIKFVKPIHISIISPDKWNDIFSSYKFISFKDRLYAYETDPYLKDFIEWCKTNEFGPFKLKLKTSDGIKIIGKRGGNFYGNYGFESNDKTRTNNSTTEKDISTRYEWFTTKRFTKNNRCGRERTSETQRRKYLPSEREKRRRANSGRYRAIKRGR